MIEAGLIFWKDFDQHFDHFGQNFDHFDHFDHNFDHFDHNFDLVPSWSNHQISPTPPAPMPDEGYERDERRGLVLEGEIGGRRVIRELNSQNGQK